MPDWAQQGSKIFAWLFAYKVFSIAWQMYFGNLVGSQASSESPWMSLKMIAHLSSSVVMLRGIDALIDPAFQKLNPLKRLTEEDRIAINAETAAQDLTNK